MKKIIYIIMIMLIAFLIYAETTSIINSKTIEYPKEDAIILSNLNMNNFNASQPYCTKNNYTCFVTLKFPEQEVTISIINYPSELKKNITLDERKELKIKEFLSLQINQTKKSESIPIINFTDNYVIKEKK